MFAIAQRFLLLSYLLFLFTCIFFVQYYVELLVQSLVVVSMKETINIQASRRYCDYRIITNLCVVDISDRLQNLRNFP